MTTMTTKALLRWLIVMEVLLVIATIVASFVGQSSLPEPLRTYEDTRFTDPSLSQALVVGLPALWFLAGRAVAWIGLLIFWRHARIWYLVTTMVGLAMGPFLGPYIQTGWSYTLGAAALLINGFLLALIYYSPLKELYEKKAVAAD